MLGRRTESVSDRVEKVAGKTDMTARILERGGGSISPLKHSQNCFPPTSFRSLHWTRHKKLSYP